MSQLAESSVSSRSRLSHAIARLEAAGWVRRRSCDEDRRGSFAELTAEGMAKLVEAAPGHVEAVPAGLFDVLSDDQQHALREIGETRVAPLWEAPIGPADGDGRGGTQERRTQD